MILRTTLTVAVASLLLAACGDDTGGGGGSGAGAPGAGGSGGSTTDSTSTSTSTGGDQGGGGATSTGGGGDGGAPACSGDAEAFEAIQKTGVACEAHADCCVVVNGCIAEAVIVGADDFESAQASWPSCENDCVDCRVPYVEVACEGGVCVGYADEAGEGAPATSHCGVEDPGLGNNGPGESFDCSGVPE